MYKMRCYVGTVLYRSGIKYVSDYLTSWENQEETDFELVLINQDVEDPDSYFQDSSLNYKIYNARKHEVSYENIQQILDIAVQNKGDVLVFGDLDDFFSIDPGQIFLHHHNQL